MIHEPDRSFEDGDVEPLLVQSVEQLLGDAYDAPTVPASLLQRLDQQITQEWGRSPELVPTRATLLRRSMTVAAPWFNVARIAACVVLAVGALMFFGRGTPAYAWSSMIQALERQGIVQLDGPGVKRWLSISEGVLSEQSDTTLTLLDTRQHVMLERNQQETQIRRRVLPAEWMGSDRDRLVLMFLLGNVGSTMDADRLKGARLIQERYESVNQGERKSVSLFVRWQMNHAEQVDFRLTLDPVTHLPTACELTGDKVGPAASLGCSYPAVLVAELRAIEFPDGDPVVDVDDQGQPIAASSTVTSNSPFDRTQTGGIKTAFNSDVPADNQFAAASSPAAWKPVELNSRPRQEVLQQIDRTLEELWKANRIEPALPADEEELLRRVFLDLCGRTPSVHEIRSYLADKSPDRYERLVDRLLQHRDHASHLATIWRSFLIPEGVDLTAFGGVDAFDRWLADRFGKNDPYDSTVRSLLLAEGRLSRSGPLLFYSAAKLDPDLLAARSARVFLGMRLECAQCHNHPFEPWTQEEFWGFAAFFAQISRPQGDLRAASTVMQVRDVDHGEVKLPKTDSVIAPHFLNGDTTQPSDRKPGVQPESRRQELARWLTAVENPYFARATANRVWSIMFGKGIVDPVDDFGIRHQPKSPQLLELLAGRFVGTKFDLRDLFRTVALSRAYRLSSGAKTADLNRSEWFAQMNVKTFSAEQVYDCMAVATMLDTASTADPFSFNLARAGNSERDQFLQQFRTPSGRSTEYLGGIPQALTLMNGTLIDNATGMAKSGLLKSLKAPFFTNKQRVEVVYLAVLSRHPRPAEWEVLNQYINDKTPAEELQENLSDILWALLNSAEFTMNH
ncbi:MAG: DUF1549 and DUF1553 domain-containing protein [Planctomycetota bacterium]